MRPPLSFPVAMESVDGVLEGVVDIGGFLWVHPSDLTILGDSIHGRRGDEFLVMLSIENSGIENP